MRTPAIIIFFMLFAALIVLAIRITPQPFTISEDMGVQKEFVKRASIPQEDSFYKSKHYAKRTITSLAAAKDDDLENFRCSATFMRNDQGVYVLEHLKILNKRTRRIKNDEFIEYMRNKERSMPTGKKILTGRLCETEDKTILLFYSIGTYDNQMVDKTNIRKAILYSTANTAYLEILPKHSLSKGKLFELSNSQAHTRCDQPFQIQKNQILTIMCLEEVDWSSNYLVKEVNLTNGTITILETCKNRFEEYVNELKEVTCN